MSLMTSLYTGVTGLDTTSTELSVIGDNIANANTIGFKAGRAAFEDALAQTLIGGAQRGLGSRLQAIQKLMSQGALANTGIATDLAVSGNGFFVVKGMHDGVESSYYTRAGQFTVDNSGFLVNLDGLKVQGFGADANGIINGTLGDLDVGDAVSPPRPTANITFKGNLDASDPVLVFDPADPANSSSHQITTTVYDSLGAAHEVNVYFNKTAAGAWEYHAMADGAGLTGGTAGTQTQIATGTLAFDLSGNLTASAGTSTFNPIGAVQNQGLTFDLGTPGGAPGMTQTDATDSTTSFINQDGFASGALAKVAINTDGQIVGTFTNGQTRALGAVALADFEAPDQLSRLGGNLFSNTPGSGQPNVGRAGSGGRGAIIAGALEQSNVDLSGEFVRMIAAQRGFQANSKTISTADQLLAELIQLKR